MKNKVLFISLFVFLLIIALILILQKQEPPEKVDIKPNTVSQQDALFSLVSVGNRIEDDNVYFIQWETLSESEKESTIKEQELYLFSQSSFQDKQYESLIKELISKEKTVMFYGYKLELEKLLANKTDLIPFYEIGASQEIFTYLYGYGRSTKIDKMLPITVMGNFTEDEMSYYIMDYLKSTYGKKAE